MRELTARIRFNTPSLGNVRGSQPATATGEKWPCFYMPRTPEGNVRLEATWWLASLRFAADVLCLHQRAVSLIHPDVAVIGQPRAAMYKRYFSVRKYVKHEAFMEGDEIGVNFVVPDEISDEDFGKLMQIVGKFKGISPYGPRQWGFFGVVSVLRKQHSTDVRGI